MDPVGMFWGEFLLAAQNAGVKTKIWSSWKSGKPPLDMMPKQLSGGPRLTHNIHAWYVYLHLVDVFGKCR